MSYSIPPLTESPNTGTLLTYLVSTDPGPLQVSTPYTPTTGTMNIAVFNPANAYCKEIDVAIPYGATEDALFGIIPSLAVNTPNWVSSAARIVSGRSLGLDTDTQYASFYLTCKDPNYYQVNYNFVICVQGPVNLVTGDAIILLQETASATSSPYNWQTQTYSFPLSKALPVFYLKNFVAVSPVNPTVPAGEFGNGAAIQLSWESNGSFFQVFEKGITNPIYAGIQTTYTLKAGLATDTTFILVASVTGNPASDPSPEPAGYTPVYLYETLTVTISNPDLTPNSVTAAKQVSAQSLAISGPSTLSGTLNITGLTTAGQVTASSLNVQGQTTLAATTVNNTLNAAANATVGGLLTASANATVNGLLTAGTATINGLLTALGNVAMLGTAQTINAGSYTAPTDGLVVGYVGGPGNNGQLCRTIITGSTPGSTVNATGGNYCCFFSWSGSSGTSWVGGIGNSFTLPVKKGNGFSTYVYNDPSNGVNAPTAFYWVPIGSGSVSAPERIGDAAPVTPINDMVAISQTGSHAPDMHDLDISDLMDVLDDILRGKITNQQRAKLQQAVRRIVYFETKFPSKF